MHPFENDFPMLIIPRYHGGLKLTKRIWQYFKDHHLIIYEQISDNKFQCFFVIYLHFSEHKMVFENGMTN